MLDLSTYLKNSLVDNDAFIAILLVSMFFASGVEKVSSFDATVTSLTDRVSMLSKEIAQLAILLVILLEILAPLIIVFNVVTGQYSDYAYTSVIALCVFTIVATFVYHMPDFSSYKRSLAFWANVSLLGGLLLLAKRIRS